MSVNVNCAGFLCAWIVAGMLRTSTLFAAAALAAAALQGTIADHVLAGTPVGTLSPDERLVSYFDAANHEFQVDAVGTGQSVARVSINGYVGTSAISWDGKVAAFSSGIRGEGAGLRVLELAKSGASPRLLLKGLDIDPVEWSRDGSQILAVADAGNHLDVELVGVADGALRVLKQIQPLNAALFFNSLALSPDAAFLAYNNGVAGASRNAVFLLPTNGGAEVRLLEPTAWQSVVGWSPDGRQLLVFSDRAGSPGLWDIPVRNGQRTGEPRLVKDAFDGIPKAVAAQGDVVYEHISGPPAARLVTVSIDRDGRATSPPVTYATRDPRAFARFPRWSPDGKSFLYVVSEPLHPAVVIQSTETPASRQIPLNLHDSRGFSTFDWSHDGRSLIFKGVNVEGQNCLCLADITTGAVKTIALQAGPYYQPRFSASDTAVSYFIKRPGQAPQSVTWSYVERDLQTGTERPLIPDLSRLMADPKSYPAGRSPDGRFLLAEINGDPARLLEYDTTTAEVKEIFRTPGEQAFNHYGDIAWMSDSRAVITTVATTLHDDGNEQELWWIPVDGRTPHKIDVGTTKIGENPIAIRPDGVQIAFVAGRPFNGVMPFDLRPEAVGSPVELRLLENVFPRAP